MLDTYEDELAIREMNIIIKNQKNKKFIQEVCIILERYKKYHFLQKIIANNFIYQMYSQNINSNFIWKLAYPRPHWDFLRKSAAKAGIDPYLALAVMREESHFNPKAISRAYAMGLMQLTMTLTDYPV